METIVTFFERDFNRYMTSGTLITCYLVADLLARRAGIKKLQGTPHPPRWVHPFVFVSLTAFYLLIGPTGGARFGGWGNLAGIALALVACGLRFTKSVRYPELAGRGFLYVALPLAVGTPWGWLALTLPAWATSAYVAMRADRAIFESSAVARTAVPAHRMIPGIW